MTRVSVIIPTHSRPHLLRRAVESAKIAGNDVEVIVVDDASTDGTAQVCRSLSGIKYVRAERNQGVAGARNIGLFASRSPYIAFLDDDDTRVPGSLDVQIERLEANPHAGLVYSPVILADQQGIPLGRTEPRECPSGDIFWELLERSFIYPQAAVVRRECIQAVGLFRADIPGIDEWDLWVRIAELFEFVVMPDPVAVYSVPGPTTDNLTTSMSAELCTAYVRHQLELFQLPRARNAAAAKRAEARRHILDLASDKLLFGAKDDLAAGVRISARRKVLAAIRLNPGRALRPQTLRLLFRGMATIGTRRSETYDSRVALSPQQNRVP
jgi:glycosyltransferase involved in cell wall biosynthesis